MERGRRPDVVVARRAARRLSLVLPDDARSAGLSRDAVRHRLRHGRCERKRRGVYGIAGILPAFEQEVEAARLSHGPDALVTGPTAARVWGMAGRHEQDGIHILTLTPGKARGPGIVTRRSKVIVPADRASWHGVGVTSWARTFVENSARSDLTDRQLGWILDDGLRRRLVTLDEVVATVSRLRPAQGRRLSRVKALLAARGVGYDPGASQPEVRIADWLASAGFPRPELNVLVEAGGVRWELDGAYVTDRVCWDYHSSFVHGGPGGITTAQKDTRKALVLKQAGWRYSTFDETTDAPAAVEVVAYDLRHARPATSSGPAPRVPTSGASGHTLGAGRFGSVRAWILDESPGAYRRGEVGDPEGGADEVRVRLVASALNHMDLWVTKGLPKPHVPHVPGADGAGVVDAVGEGVDRVGVGDEVVLNPAVACGRCRQCLRDESPLCPSFGILGEHRWGTHAEAVVVPARQVVAKPAGRSWEECAAYGLCGLTAWRMLKRAGLRAGETLLVVGVGGGVSSFGLLLGLAMGAHVVVTSRDEAKRTNALAIGAAEAYDSGDDRWPVRADVVLENVGRPTWDKSLRALVPGGRLVTCGGTAGADVEISLPRLFFKQHHLIGSTMGSYAEFDEVTALVARGLAVPVDQILPVDALPEALQRLERGAQLGKIVLRH